MLNQTQPAEFRWPAPGNLESGSVTSLMLPSAAVDEPAGRPESRPAKTRRS